MFTGIIEEVGTVRRIGPGQICIQAKKALLGTKAGDSIAVNGVCLTATKIEKDAFCADVMPETLARSSLGALGPGGRVNLERAMAADGRFGGHIVSGHIDGTGTVRSIKRDGNAVRYRIAAPPGVMRLIVEKGSVAIDGVSLTVASAGREQFEVSVIPHTLGETSLCEKKEGSLVNLENDVIGKYVERLLFFEKEGQEKTAEKPALTREFLLRAGF